MEKSGELVKEESRVYEYLHRAQKDVSHDIKNSLQSINTASELLRNYLDLILKDDEADIESHVHKMENIIHRVLRRSKIIEQLVNELDHAKEGVDWVSFDRCNLKILLKNMVEDYQNTHSAGKRVYELHFAPATNMAIIDSQKIHRIFENLLNNATKFTPEGMIIVEVLEDEANWIVSVKDSGCGIPKDKLGAIFERFVRIKNSSTSEVKGSGIGLDIVKHFVDLHFGSIKVSSIPDKRSVFKVYLPKSLPVGQYYVGMDEPGKLRPRFA